jgi:hypothetical protein
MCGDLTLLHAGAEDAVEGVLAGLCRWSDGHLNLHQLGPGGVSLHAESLHSIGDTGIHLAHLGVQVGDDDEDGDDGSDAGHRGESDHHLRFVHHLHFC